MLLKSLIEGENEGHLESLDFSQNKMYLLAADPREVIQL